MSEVGTKQPQKSPSDALHLDKRLPLACHVECVGARMGRLFFLYPFECYLE
ncbi:MAG: hypothetical protein ACI89U_001528 [Gammaproteobacteria bacterium]|jgi:hypothetical protein